MHLRQIIIITATLFISMPSAPVFADAYAFVTFQYPPLEFAGENEKAEGIAVEIVANIMEALGHEVEITVYPWTRALKRVREGAADAIFTAYKNAERETFLDYSRQVLIPQVVYFYQKRGSAVQFDGSLESVKTKRIGVVSTISYGDKFDRFKTNLVIDKAHKLEHNFFKLLLDRVDLVPSDIYVAEYTLGRLNLGDRIVRLSPGMENVPSYIAFAKKRNLAALRDRFDKQLSLMKETGEYAEIIGKYDFINLRNPDNIR